MLQNKKNVTENNNFNRFLPINKSIELGLESEPKISDFKVIKELGIGSFGRVLLVQHNKTKAIFALKVIEKTQQYSDEEKNNFIREVEIMYKIHHPNIVKLYGHFEDDTYCYLLMEYIERGELYSYIPENGQSKLTTQQIASIIIDVISAIYYLHHMNPPIMHRDIKPENILITSDMKAKLIDFGWSAYINPGEIRNSICGTPVYLAPEIINRTGHNEKVDIWSIGVLLFELLTGDQAWAGENVETVKYNICNLRISWPEEMDALAADLISEILKTKPEERISLRDMLKHPFFTQYFSNPSSHLIIPDNKKYKVFIISKDNPLTWNPICTEVNYEQKQINFNPILTSSYITYNPNPKNFNNTYEQFYNIEMEYNQIQKPKTKSITYNYLQNDFTKIEEEEKIDWSSDESSKNYINEFSKNNENSDIYKIESYNLSQYEPYEFNYINNNFNNSNQSIEDNNKNGLENNFIQFDNNFDFNIQNNLKSFNGFKEKKFSNKNEEEKKRKEIEEQLYNSFNNDCLQYDSLITFDKNNIEEFSDYLF